MSNHATFYTVAQRALRTLVICPIMVIAMVSYNLILHSAWSFGNLGAALIYMFPIAYFLDFALMFYLVRAIVHKINRPKQWWIYSGSPNYCPRILTNSAALFVPFPACGGSLHLQRSLGTPCHSLRERLYPTINVGLMAILCSGIALTFSDHFSLTGWVSAFAINYPVALAFLIMIAKPIGDKILVGF